MIFLFSSKTKKEKVSSIFSISRFSKLSKPKIEE